ncbi:hypothetical protein ACOSQ2_014046 [Xanthoceras sorbifolium]
MNLVWYVDGGATNHITSDIGNMFIISEFRGQDKLTVDNGVALDIAHVGSSIICSNTSPQMPLYLNNILHVPSITQNLLSISQFIKDDNVILEFNYDVCSIKDKTSKRILLQADPKLLHKLPTSFNSSSSQLAASSSSSSFQYSKSAVVSPIVRNFYVNAFDGCNFANTFDSCKSDICSSLVENVDNYKSKPQSECVDLSLVKTSMSSKTVPQHF